jgi:adenylate cyclase
LTLQILDQTSLVIDKQIRSLLVEANQVGDFTRRLIQVKALRVDDRVGLVRHFTAVLQSSPSLTGIFLGTEQAGECIGVSRRGDELIVWELHKNPATSRLEIREYRPDDYPTKPVRIDINGDSADCRQRPWYLDARKAGRQIWSRAYPFFMFSGNATVPGITCATPFYSELGDLSGVIAIDIRLDKLCNFLGTLRVGNAGFPFIVEPGPGGERHVIAHPDSNILLHQVRNRSGAVHTELTSPEDISDRRITEFMAEVPHGVESGLGHEQVMVRFHEGGSGYLGAYKLLPESDLPDWLVCTVIPEDEVLAQARADGRLAVIIGVIVLTTASLISFFVSGHFSRSLVQLVQQTKAVGQFQVEASAPVESILLEVDQLARATEQMKTSLRSFGKYVPTDLVRQLLASGIEARPGGEERVLTIFFCDLANFTTISESLSPRALVEQLGEYFHAFTEEISATGGTVDKFIGDAVMAFWGAPLERADHASAACRCALACQRRLAELRESWAKRGMPAFFCRIGLNTGPVVVGNIGSRGRLNYTVIGDAVNVASRLEGLNKHYGTNICISEETFRAANGSIVARPIDRVSVKGKSTPTLVYELLSMSTDARPELQRLAELQERALEHYRRREWVEAIAGFEEIVRLKPGDGPSTELMNRCRKFQERPPDADWNGLHQMESK